MRKDFLLCITIRNIDTQIDKLIQSSPLIISCSIDVFAAQTIRYHANQIASSPEGPSEILQQQVNKSQASSRISAEAH